jgi:hypothetical protein
MNRQPLSVAALVAVLAASTLAAEPKPKPYNLKPIDLKQPILWGSSVLLDGKPFYFGGQDQESPDGIGHTRGVLGLAPVNVDSLWSRHNESQRNAYGSLLAARDLFKANVAYARSMYLDDLGAKARFNYALRDVKAKLDTTFRKLPASAYQQVKDLAHEIELALAALTTDVSPANIAAAEDVLIRFEQFAESVNVEPPPRALSPLVLTRTPIKQEQLIVVFGGDHFDYLTNDTWVFWAKTGQWQLRHPPAAPRPRANHTLKDNGDGTVTLTGGYTYANNTDYCGGQYVDLDDGEWTYNVIQDVWLNPKSAGVSPTVRTYRGGPFHPAHFLQGEKPDAEKFQAWLKKLPPNTWTKTRPPQLPQLNRDWGTAVLDTDRGLILRWAGGHSAHGGSDVLHYHTATNRWELPYPVEFPLGQLYSNTSYPEIFNFNRRPWVTGHTYQSYAYEPQSRQMLFVGKRELTYFYDPELADWLSDTKFKPEPMAYGDCYYTLTCCTTPRGVYCWTNNGKLFLHDAQKKEWAEVKLTGDKLAGSAVDNSTLVHDARRDRLLFFRKPYGDKVAYDGKLQSVDLETLTVKTIAPGNAAAASAVSYLCQIRYDAANDLLLAGCTLPPDETGLRRTVGYDLKADRWTSLKVTGEDPNTKRGRNVSLGLMYDAPRKLFWAVDAASEVYVLRLDVKTADLRPL